MAADEFLGRKIESFELEDAERRPVRYSDYVRDAKATVVAFLGIECPLAKAYATRLADLERSYAERGVKVVAIDSNEQDSLSELMQFSRANQFGFPLLKDPGQKIADRFGAQRTPEFFLLDADQVIRYHGRFDDQYGVGYQRPEVNRRDLATALNELLAGQPISVPSTDAPGCLIGRRREAKADAPVTWSKQIVRIMQERCQECHRPNEIGPFSLIDYDEVVGWAGMIQEVVEQGRMPPWHASPEHGEFANDARLSEEEKRLISQWVDDGAPEGDPADLPPPREFDSAWAIGEPDLVLYNTDDPQEIPATGVVDYRYFVIDPGFRENKWVHAAQLRPSAPAVVHHISVYVQSPTDTWTDSFRHLFAGFQPGATVQKLSSDIAHCVPAGSKFVFQVHYTPCGTPQTDRIALGLKFADPAEVKRRFVMLLVKNQAFRIPPGATDYPVEASMQLLGDIELLGFVPHMHLRGKMFRYSAAYPDGTEETLLEVPQFDFNWQHAYLLKDLKPIPSGTTIKCLATYDNSSDNATNPDPTVTVEFGHQIWDEMMDGYVAVTIPVTPDMFVTKPPPAPKTKKTAQPDGPALPLSRMRWPWFTLGGLAIAGGALSAREWQRRRQKRTASEVAASQEPAAAEIPPAVQSTPLPSAATRPGAKVGARLGMIAWLIFVVCLAVWPLGVLYDTEQALASGWRPESSRLYSLVVSGAWLIVLLAAALVLIPPLRRAGPRYGITLLIMLVLAVIAVAAYERSTSSAWEASAFHLREPNRDVRMNFGDAAFFNGNKTGHASYNSLGVRAAEMPPRDSSRRILTLGGSSTECLYLENEQTWPQLLERQLNGSESGDYWVGNVGKSDCTTADDLAFLEKSVLAASVDTVLLMVGMDDLWHTLTERPIESPQPPDWYRSPTVALFEESPSTEDSAESSEAERARDDYFWARRRDSTFPPPPATKPDFVAAVEAFRQRVEKIAAWGKSHGVQVVFVTQPVLWDKDISQAARKHLTLAQVNPVGKEWTFLTADNLRPLIDRYNDVLRAVSQETGTKCIDLAAEMTGHEFFFEDDFHFNAEGCQRAARLLAEQLLLVERLFTSVRRPAFMTSTSPRQTTGAQHSRRRALRPARRQC
ncbi:MAG: redoxin domain-containing protein [Pirellulales bacterium]|nr:redoxin domain-containing protein [Pirellulales bacterium]